MRILVLFYYNKFEISAALSFKNPNKDMDHMQEIASILPESHSGFSLSAGKASVEPVKAANPSTQVSIEIIKRTPSESRHKANSSQL